MLTTGPRPTTWLANRSIDSTHARQHGGREAREGGRSSQGGEGAAAGGRGGLRPSKQGYHTVTANIIVSDSAANPAYPDPSECSPAFPSLRYTWDAAGQHGGVDRPYSSILTAVDPFGHRCTLFRTVIRKDRNGSTAFCEPLPQPRVRSNSTTLRCGLHMHALGVHRPVVSLPVFFKK